MYQKHMQFADDQVGAENEMANRLASEYAASLEKMRSAILQNVSHELITPLNAIVGMSDFLLTEFNQDPALLEDLKVIHSAGLQLTERIKALLELNTLVLGSAIVNPTPCSLHAVAQASLQQMQHKVAAHNKDIVVQVISPSLDPEEYVLADTTKIKKILDCLIDNAVKFTEKGTIVLEASRQIVHNKVIAQFLLFDTGIGIPPAMHKKIFEPFIQVDMEMTRAYGGMGIGLALVNALAKLMNGHITLDSYPGAGSTFGLQVPLELLSLSAVMPSAGDLATIESMG